MPLSSIFIIFFKIKTHYGFVVFDYLKKNKKEPRLETPICLRFTSRGALEYEPSYL